MLDANAFVNWEAKRFDLPGYLRKRGSEPVAVSAIVWQQLWFGAEHFESDRAAKRRRFLTAIFPFVRVVSFDAAHAREAAVLDARLRISGQQVGYADTLIAAAALTLGAELLTFNRAEFERTGVPLAAM